MKGSAAIKLRPLINEWFKQELEINDVESVCRLVRAMVQRRFKRQIELSIVCARLCAHTCTRHQFLIRGSSPFNKN